MLSKAQIKHITALRTKKYRLEHSQFIVEGKKSVIELLKSNFETLHVYYTTKHEIAFERLDFKNISCISEKEISQISAQKNPEGALAVAKIPKTAEFIWQDQPYIALDQIRDPGNLGTIIRLADWFGIKTVLCSSDCVELYNPKVIQASMGSIFNTEVKYTSLADIFSKTNLPRYAATLSGSNIYKNAPIENGILVIGNEANGISDEVMKVCQHNISIPSKGQAESLNAAMACGILCSHLFR